ncbi:hypothetical protein U1Q18_034995 [Sarracenia purpurea var. burkii]
MAVLVSCPWLRGCERTNRNFDGDPYGGRTHKRAFKTEEVNCSHCAVVKWASMGLLVLQIIVSAIYPELLYSMCDSDVSGSTGLLKLISPDDLVDLRWVISLMVP